MSSVNDIRKAFLSYFEERNHNILPSGMLVPSNDPTLMFTNAGMVPFKNYFTGVETPSVSRATTSQKCVRAGGKHNDLDNVGYTARHHTFFEMLGNFSFGDYFKEEAIVSAWQLLTKTFEIPEEKLLVTVYHEDEEAALLWKKVAGLSDDRIIKITTNDNFWSMGDTGPCGPCSEIFFDHGDEVWGGPPGSADEDGDRFIEIWNLVFMQYEQVDPDTRVSLPKPSIDTGMGLERIAAVLQGQHNNYDIDMFRSLIASSQEYLGVKAEGDNLASHRVIADHLRATSFLIADGVLPSNEGRGYVLRRIMRRAMRHANLLGSKQPVIYKMVPTLINEMGEAYPELIRAKALITETLESEERRFGKTLERGISLLKQETQELAEGATLNGEVAFKLYDTYGFPLDLTQDALRARSIDVNVDEFNLAMERQKVEARASWSGSGEKASDAIWFSIYERLGATEFLGYKSLQAEAVIEEIIVGDDSVSTITKGQKGLLVTNQTPFYAESGGQVGDEGMIAAPAGVFIVTDTLKKAGKLFVHEGYVSEGEIGRKDIVNMKVDDENRNKIATNHSATHLLHEALRLILGDHVAQKGSRVSSQSLRFDFSHNKPVSEAELAQIEEIANNEVLNNSPVETRLMPVDDAIKSGARALFGEKYGDEVRVVSMGQITENNNAFSVELCGGTHVKRTGDIGLIKVVQETSVSSGVRRIEALTAHNARSKFNEDDQALKSIATLLKAPSSDVLPRLTALLDERKSLEAALSEANKKLALSASSDSAGDNNAKTINGIHFIQKIARNLAPKDLKAIVDEAKAEKTKTVVALINVADDNRAGVVVGVTKDLIDTISAVDLVRIASSALGGKGGGGRPDMAQAGGPDGAKADIAMSKIAENLA